MENVVIDGLKHVYRDETWSKKSFTSASKPQDFLGRKGIMQFFEHIPTIL
jgi:hypothetical protein